MRELLLGFLAREQPDARALLRARLREDEPGSTLEHELERRRLRPLVAELQQLEPPGGHEVDEQHEVVLLGREEQTLRAALGAGELPTLKRRQGRVERLQRRDVGGAGLDDRG